MPLLIKNGEIITASQRYVADIFCEDETITRIDRNLTAPPGAEVIDVRGKYVFPGFIDPHVHIYLPFMGTFAKDDYDSGSRDEYHDWIGWHGERAVARSAGVAAGGIDSVGDLRESWWVEQRGK